MDLIASHPSDALRQRWSQHELDNTFNHMPLADPIRGIFGATPVETMHAFRKGVIEVVTFLVLTDIPPATKKAALDVLAIRFHKSHRQTYRKAYPATDFSNGITNLTKISAAERLGLVFLFVILAQYDEGCIREPKYLRSKYIFTSFLNVSLGFFHRIIPSRILWFLQLYLQM